MHTHVRREEASASYNFGWFMPTVWPPYSPVSDQTGGHWQGCPSPKVLFFVPMSARIPRSAGRVGLLSWRLLDGYRSVIDRDKECRDGDCCDRLLRASDESLLLREMGPKEKAVTDCSQTTAELLRCILMASEKRHQQATILDGSGLRLGHPSPLSATRRSGIGKVVQVRRSLICTNVSTHTTVPRQGRYSVMAAA